jgi:hypothetical protein
LEILNFNYHSKEGKCIVCRKHPVKKNFQELINNEKQIDRSGVGGVSA